MKKTKLTLKEFEMSLTLDDVLSPDQMSKVLGGDDSSGSFSEEDFFEAMMRLLNSEHGGTWTAANGTSYEFTSSDVDAIHDFINGYGSYDGTPGSFCYLQNGVPTHMPIQSGQDCVPSTLGYIAALLGGDITSSITNFTNYLTNQGLADDIENVGVTASLSQLNSFMNQYFHTSSLQAAGGVFGALDHGNPIFALIPASSGSGYHAITVVGYSVDADNNANLDNLYISYMNPATGTLGTMSMAEFNRNALGAIVVTGKK